MGISATHPSPYFAVPGSVRVPDPAHILFSVGRIAIMGDILSEMLGTLSVPRPRLGDP